MSLVTRGLSTALLVTAGLGGFVAPPPVINPVDELRSQIVIYRWIGSEGLAALTPTTRNYSLTLTQQSPIWLIDAQVNTWVYEIPSAVWVFKEGD